MRGVTAPTIGATITAGHWFVWVRRPACRTTQSIDLRLLDRRPDAAITSLIPSLSCPSCRPNAPFAELVRLSQSSVAEEIYAESAEARRKARDSVRAERATQKTPYTRICCPKLNSRSIRLLDIARSINQLAALERRTSRGGKDTIDHPPGGHDDLGNVIAGVAACVMNQSRNTSSQKPLGL